MVNGTWATKAEWAVGEDLGSDHLPITIAVSCQVPNPSVTHRCARWNTKDVNWQGFADAVDTTLEKSRNFGTEEGRKATRSHCILQACQSDLLRHQNHAHDPLPSGDKGLALPRACRL